MTREQAQQECERLGREHPDREACSWFPREDGPGDWSVVRVAIPGASGRRGMKATEEAKPRPQQADDPRQWWERQIPPFGGAGA
ncbi:MAG TPA: hypothetical protein VF545_01055 [Thermoleophilaceae bacterium]